MPPTTPTPTCCDANAWIRKNSRHLVPAVHDPHGAGVEAVPGQPAYIDAVVLQRLVPLPRAAAQDRRRRCPPRRSATARARSSSYAATIISHSCVPEFYLGGPPAADRHGHAQADRRARRRRVRPGLRRAAQPRLPPQPRARAAVSDANLRAQLLPERRAQVFEADAIGITPGDRLHASLKRFMATANAVRAAVALRVPPRHLQPRPVPLPGERGDAGARLRRPRRGRPAVAGRRRVRDHAQQPDDPGDHEGHPLQHRRRLGQLRGPALLRPRQRRRRRPLHLGLPLRRLHPGRHGQRRPRWPTSSTTRARSCPRRRSSCGRRWRAGAATR